MITDYGKNRILVAPAPNWFCKSALSLNEEKGFYVYSTKNSLILGTILENRILGSVYCGIKSKPIGVTIFISSHLSEEATLIASTHFDCKIRFWEIVEQSNGIKEVSERDDLYSDEKLKPWQGKEKSINMLVDSLKINLISDSIKCSSLANVVYYYNGQVFVGDVQGVILKISVSDFRNKDKPETFTNKFHPIKEEITLIDKTADNEKLAVGYKNGQVIIISILNGDVLLILEDESMLKEKCILSIIDLSSQMIVSTSKGNNNLFSYCKKSEKLEKIELVKTLKQSISSQKIEKVKRKNQYKTQKTQGCFWTLLLSYQKGAKINGDKFYIIMDHEIAEFELLKNKEIDIKRKFSIKNNEKERNKDSINSEIIFSVLSYEFNTKYYLLGITKSKRVFLFNTTEWKLEWIMNTLGGWIDELISPNGFSHIIYILSGEGKLMGMDLLESHKDFTQRINSSYIYENLSGFNKDEQISKISINPINSEYIFYSTNFGNLGILYINPDNISHYSNIKIRIEISNHECSKQKDICNKRICDQKNSEFKDFLSNSDLDWLVLLRSPSSCLEDLKVPLSDFQQNIHFKSNNSSDGKFFNSQVKLFNSLIYNLYRFPIILIFNYKKNKCVYADLSPGFENGELIINAIPRSFEIQSRSEIETKEDHIIRLKTSNKGIGAEYYNTAYFVTVNGKAQIEYLGKNLLQSIQTNKLNIDKVDDHQNELISEKKTSIYIYKLVFSLVKDDQINLDCFEKMEIENALKTNINTLELGIENRKINLERVINGLVVFNKFKDFEEIYVLITNYGNLIILSSDKLVLRLENIFKDKNKMDYDYVSISMIEVGNIDQLNGQDNSTLIFNLAISNEFNQTSIVEVKIINSHIFNKENFSAEILLIRPNTDHKGSITNKYHFKSKSIWYRDVRDFYNTFESNLRLLIGGQEQMLQLFDVSKELMIKSKHKVINKNSLLFLTNKNIYQQNNQTSIKALTLLLEVRLIYKLNNMKKFNSNESFCILKDIQSNINKVLSESGDNEVIFDLILFLNHKNSASDLIELHLSTYFNNQVTNIDNGCEITKFFSVNSNYKNIKESSQNLSLLIEYLYLINGQIDIDSCLFKNFLKKYSNNATPYIEYSQNIDINPSENNDEKFKRFVKIFQNVENDCLLIEWLRYLSQFNIKDSKCLEFLDIETDCIIRSLILLKLDNLQLKLKSINSSNTPISHKNLSVFIGENPNILHEYCILNILMGRCHKAIEMYCYYNLFQCAWLISNLYLGNDHELTLNVLRDWNKNLKSNNLMMQSFKCLIASSDFEELYQVLLERIYYISDSHYKIRLNTGGNNDEDSFSQVDKLFQNFKLTGYYLLISSSENNSKDNNKFQLLKEFSADLVDYIFLIFNRYRINIVLKNKLYSKFCFREIISIKNNQIISDLHKLIINEEKNCLMDEIFDELEMKIMRNIHLYEIVIQFSLMVFSCGNKILISELEKFLKKNNIRKKEDLFLLLKKLNYLPFEDEMKLNMELKVMKDLLILVLSFILESNLNIWISKVDETLKILYNDLFFNDLKYQKKSIFDITFEALFDIFLLKKDLENIESLCFSKELNNTLLEWMNSEFLLEFRDSIQNNFSNQKELHSKRLMATKYDLYILSVIKRINKTLVLDPVVNQNNLSLSNNNDSILTKSLNESDLENLTRFLNKEETGEFLKKNSISYHFIFKTNNSNSIVVWLYNKITNLASQSINQDLGSKAKKLAFLIKKQYLNKKNS
ncbi:uncharacterized protein cubi_01670 [Cryptosporidium ubiquitum]|uniref:Uncharacterized protein n=1 Tax=Cryptosporidium ubiquitum TaxID=857276 RepID=A0A1J4MER0_9CRYT|nr:uncharacterized protein cubi_01670 [Cryptosporidium ubiquitum]OII72720.1 hypothetical protein cubi_01670 [Cryptosporidium ubiquitum]